MPILLGTTGSSILQEAVKPDHQEPQLDNIFTFKPPLQNDPSVRNEFAVAGYRWGHPTMLDQLDALDQDDKGENTIAGEIKIADEFFNPEKVLEYGPGKCLK